MYFQLCLNTKYLPNPLLKTNLGIFFVKNISLCLKKDTKNMHFLKLFLFRNWSFLIKIHKYMINSNLSFKMRWYLCGQILRSEASRLQIGAANCNQRGRHKVTFRHCTGGMLGPSGKVESFRAIKSSISNSIAIGKSRLITFHKCEILQRRVPAKPNQ